MDDKTFRNYVIFIAVILAITGVGKAVEHYYIDPALAQMEATEYGSK